MGEVLLWSYILFFAMKFVFCIKIFVVSVIYHLKVKIKTSLWKRSTWKMKSFENFFFIKLITLYVLPLLVSNMAILPRTNNSLAPGRFKVNFRWVIFKLILVVSGWGISCETALIWVSLDHTYEKSTLVQVMAWCRQATSQYLSQCWPRFLSPYGVNRPQWVKDVPMVKVTKAPFSDLSVKDITDFWKNTNQIF